MGSDFAELEMMIDRLSPERLAPYIEAGGGDINSALELYVWNATVSAALATTIGHVEVVLRNAIHQNLTSWSTQRFAEPRWYLDPGGLLRPRQTAAIRGARQRAVQYGRHVETPGRVVAELSFGFWRFLLTGQYDTTLWRQSLFHVFPGQRHRRPIRDAIEVLHLSRNRIAHHEPMFNRPVTDIRLTALDFAGWISPTSKSWIDRHCAVDRVLDRRPCQPARPTAESQ